MKRNVLPCLLLKRRLEPKLHRLRSAQAETAADNLSKDRPVPASPVPTDSSLATAIEPDARLSLHAIEQLESEVQHVASAVH